MLIVKNRESYLLYRPSIVPHFSSTVNGIFNINIFISKIKWKEYKELSIK